MEYQCHIHPCRSARERDTAVRISERVQQAHAHDADDLVDDILFILDKSGMDEARLSAADDVRQVSIEGRLWLSWFPAADACSSAPGIRAASERRPADDVDRAFPIPEAAMRFGYNEKTLRIYVKKQWLRADTDADGNPVITESAMRTFKAGLCTGINARTKHMAPARFSARGFGAVKVKRREPKRLPRRLRRARVAERRSCMVARRSSATPSASMARPHKSAAALPCTLRPVRSAYPLRELVPLCLRRAEVLNADSATLPLLRGTGPPGTRPMLRAGP